MPANTPLGITYPVTATDSNDIGYHMQTMAESIERILADTGWRSVTDFGATFGTGWSHYVTGGWNGVQMRVKAGQLIITGAIARNPSTAGATLFTLPAAYRPSVRVMGQIATESPNTLSKIVANTDGTVTSDFGFIGTVYTITLVMPV